MTYTFKNQVVLVIAVFFCSFLLEGCGEPVDARQLKTINGLIYKIGENEPFTGTVVNYGQSNMFNDYMQWSCEVHFKKGELHGSYKCVSAETGIKTNEKNYEHNFKTGLETTWNNKGQLISKTEWIGDRLNGVKEFFNPATGKLIQQTHWLNNRMEGEEKIWNTEGEVVLTDMIWSNGKRTGFTKYGELEEEFKDSEKHGYQRRYAGDVNEWRAAEAAVHAAGAGAYSYTLFQSARLEWEELYDNGKLISRTESHSRASTQSDGQSEGSPAPLDEPNVDIN